MRNIAKRTLSAAVAVGLAVLVFVAAFGATAFAAGQVAPSDDASVVDLLRPIYDSFLHGDRVAAGALAVVALVALAKRYAGSVGPRFERFVHSDAGGVLSVFGVSFFGAVAAATTGRAWSWSVPEVAFGVAIAAIGGYTVVRKLVVDALVASSWYRTSAPAWLRSILSVVTALGAKPDAAKQASDAGDAAVAAAPSRGAAAIAGEPAKF
jgi:hypothetical protein